MRKVINMAFDFNEMVVLKTDPSIIRQVSYLIVYQNSVLYVLKKGEEETTHEEAQIQKVPTPFKVKGFR